MKVLGIETSSILCGVAIVDEGEPVVEYRLNIRNVHSEKLVSVIERVSLDSQVGFDQLGGIAISIGPGSFTGLRIGLSVAKGLAFSLDLPLAAVPTLEALASQLPQTPYLICPLLRARKDELYVAFYKNTTGRLERVRDHKILTLPQFIAEVDTETILVGEGADIYKATLTKKLKGKAIFAPKTCSLPSALSVAQLGWERLKRGEIANLETLEPLYLRDFPINAGIKQKEDGFNC